VVCRVSLDVNATALKSNENLEDGALLLRALVREGRLHEALGISPFHTSDQVRVALAHRWETYSAPLANGSTPDARALMDALETLRFLGVALLSMDARSACHQVFQASAETPVPASRMKAPVLEELRAAWLRVFPDATAAANTLVRQAMQAHQGGDVATARTRGREALRLDPFNLPLREMMDGWW
jgi:hypothetical protein